MNKKNVLVALVAIVISFLLCPVMATAAEPFIKAELYKAQGSNALTLEKFQTNPRIYYRSEHAFQMGRQYAERVTGTPLTDAGFNELLQSDRVRTKACSGEVTTGGLLPDDYHWFQRQCYPKEEILQVQVGGRWVDLLSMACLNPIEDKTPPPETARVDEPPGDNCRWVEDQVSVRTEPGQIYTTAPTAVSGCSGSVILGGSLYQAPANNYTQSVARKVCK